MPRHGPSRLTPARPARPTGPTSSAGENLNSVAQTDDDEGVRVQVVVAGMFREGDPEAHDPDFFDNVIAQLHQHWIDPALANRQDSPETITQALIVLHPDRPQVFLNDEVIYTAVAGTSARLVKPQDCFVGQITSLWPDAVNPDLAWSGYTTA